MVKLKKPYVVLKLYALLKNHGFTPTFINRSLFLSERLGLGTSKSFVQITYKEPYTVVRMVHPNHFLVEYMFNSALPDEVFNKLLHHHIINKKGHLMVR